MGFLGDDLVGVTVHIEFATVQSGNFRSQNESV